MFWECDQKELDPNTPKEREGVVFDKLERRARRSFWQAGTQPRQQLRAGHSRGAGPPLRAARRPQPRDDGSGEDATYSPGLVQHQLLHGADQGGGGRHRHGSSEAQRGRERWGLPGNTPSTAGAGGGTLRGWAGKHRRQRRNPEVPARQHAGAPAGGHESAPASRSRVTRGFSATAAPGAGAAGAAAVPAVPGTWAGEAAAAPVPVLIRTLCSRRETLPAGWARSAPGTAPQPRPHPCVGRGLCLSLPQGRGEAVARAAGARRAAAAAGARTAGLPPGGGLPPGHRPGCA